MTPNRVTQGEKMTEMAGHTITQKEFDDWVNAEAWHLAASSCGRGSRKKIEMSGAGIFRVTDRDYITYIGGDKAAAVDAYNAAP